MEHLIANYFFCEGRDGKPGSVVCLDARGDTLLDGRRFWVCEAAADIEDAKRIALAWQEQDRVEGFFLTHPAD